MDLKELHKKAGKSTGQFIAGIKKDQRKRTSNCSDWSVEELVNHIVEENLWVPKILEGKTVEEVGNRFEGDMLKNNPLRAWKESFAAAHSALEQLDSLEKTVHLSYGDVPTRRYIEERIMDIAIHGWDIAVSTNQKETLNAELTEGVYEIALPHREEFKELRGSLFANEISVPDTADLQTKLLAFLGRKRP